MVCNNCGWIPISKDELYCARCGNQLTRPFSSASNGKVCNNCGWIPISKDELYCARCGNQLRQVGVSTKNIDGINSDCQLTLIGCSIDDWTYLLFFSNDRDCELYYKDLHANDKGYESSKFDLGGWAEIECTQISENLFEYTIEDEELNRSKWTIFFDKKNDRIVIEGSIGFEVPELWELTPGDSYELKPAYDREMDCRFGYKEYIIESVSKRVHRLENFNDFDDPFKTNFRKTRSKYPYLSKF